MLKQIRGLAGLVALIVGMMLLLSARASFEAPPRNENDYAADKTPNPIEDRLLLGTSPEGWTAIFTGVLSISTIGLWIVTSQAARDTRGGQRIVERAYVFPYFEDESFEADATTRLAIALRFKNTGKTPAVVHELYGEIADAIPPKRRYENSGWLMKVHWTIAPNAIEQVGKCRRKEGGSVAFGYIKYRDIFGVERITGFAIHRYLGERWTAVTDSEWSYWT